MKKTWLNKFCEKLRFCSTVELRERAEKLSQLGLEILHLTENVVQQQTLMEAMYEIIPALIFCKDNDNNLVYINHYGAKLWGDTPAELMGKGWMEKLVKQEQAVKYLENDLEVINLAKAKMNIIEPLVSDPNRTFLTHKLPLIKEGVVIGIIGFSTEITASIKSAEKK